MKIVVVTAGLLLAGCEWLVPLDGLSGGASAGDGGVDHPTVCPPDLSSDRLNCGACGHSCLGGDCVASRCRPFAIAENQSAPLGIDVSKRFVFWVNQNPPGLMRFSKDNGDTRPISSPTDGISEPFDVAVDSDEKFVYWSELTAAQIFRKPIDGGDKMSVEPPGPGQAAFLALAGAQVYVTNYQQGNGQIVSDISLFMEPEMIGGLAVRDGVVYFARKESGKIAAGPITGGTANVLVDAVVGQPMGVAVDADNVYWIEDGLRLRQAPRRGGGTPVTLYEAPQPFGDSDVAADGTAIYWTEHGMGAMGVVRRLAR